METAKLLLIQALVMTVLAMIGYILFKCKKITKEGSKAIGSILIYVSLPSVIFRGFLIERTKDSMIGLGISFVAAIITLVIGILISKLLNRKDAIANFACCFSNPGFFGIPLIIASISEGAVFYVASYVACLNIMQWTYGVYLLTKNKKDISIKRIATAPSMIAFLLGVIFFFIGIGNKLPSVFTNILSLTAGINTPLAMFTIGIYLAQTNLIGMFKRLSNYKVSIIKLVIIPVIVFPLFFLIPKSYMDLRLALLICVLCPTGSNIAVLAELNNSDYPYAVETVVISTLFSLASIPLLVLLASVIWGI